MRRPASISAEIQAGSLLTYIVCADGLESEPLYMEICLYIETHIFRKHSYTGKCCRLIVCYKETQW